MATPIVTDNGRQIDGFYLIDNRTWIRSQRTSVNSLESIFVASRQDATPVHSTYPIGHDSRCGWCYLGAGHSEQAHNDRTGA